VILGFIRPEYDYVSKESLIDDINTDIAVTKLSLERPAYSKFKEESCLSKFPKKTE
jgi:riboflavin kinase